MTPTARSLKLLRSRGWTAQAVEKWNAHSRTRLDLFGFGDILACRRPFSENSIPQQAGIVMVQATTHGHLGSRLAKIAAEPKARIWLASGGQIELHGWRKLKVKRGGKAVRWECETRPVFMFHLDAKVPLTTERGVDAR